jgi:hypothetical protein
LNGLELALLGVELIDEHITELQWHICVQHGWLANGGFVPHYEPARLYLLFFDAS